MPHCALVNTTDDYIPLCDNLFGLLGLPLPQPGLVQGSCWGHVCSRGQGGRLPGFTFAEELLNGCRAGAAHLLRWVDHGQGVEAQSLQTQGDPSLRMSFT